MINFENEVERDFYDYLIKQKGYKDVSVCNCIKHLRKIKPLNQLIDLGLERSIKSLEILRGYMNENSAKYGWGKVMSKSTNEELAELHRWMRKD